MSIKLDGNMAGKGCQVVAPTRRVSGYQYKAVNTVAVLVADMIHKDEIGTIV